MISLEDAEALAAELERNRVCSMIAQAARVLAAEVKNLTGC